MLEMRNRFVKLGLLGVLVLIAFATSAASVWALDLFEAYNKAKNYDPEYLSAYHAYKASLTLPKQSIARALPQISGSYTISEYNFTSAPPAYQDYGAEQKMITMQQSIFNAPLIMEIKQSKLSASSGEMRFRNAEQNLMKRVANAYFDLLYAEAALKVTKDEIKTYREQLEMVKRLFNAGEATIADMNDAEARLSDAIYRGVDVEKNLYTKKQELARLIGEEPSNVAILPEDLSPEELTPADVNEWIAMAKENSPVVKFYSLQKDVSDYELKKQRAQRLPSLNAFSQYSSTNTRDYLKTPTISYVSVGLQVSMPLFTGGYISAKEAEAKERLAQATKDYEKAVSDVSQSVVDSFFGVKSSIAAVESARSSVKASEVAVLSTQKGYQAGIRTFVDVLNAETNYYKARLNLVKSLHEYVKYLVNLKFYAGLIKEEDMLKINGWLKRSGD
jgi:TolC family type I secretion outer membrane protein